MIKPDHLTRKTAVFIQASKKSINTQIKPKTHNQETYLKHLNDWNVKIIIAIGKPGSGKTLLATKTALEHLNMKKMDKLILTRPTINNGNDLGALPGNIHKKMNPWLRSIYDQAYKFTGKQGIESYLKNEKIEICPLEFTRGRSFESCFILGDEMQNSTPSQTRMLLTRIGEGSKMILTGDLEQTDIKGQNGLENFINLYDDFGDIDQIKIVKFDDNDVVRSEIVKKVLEIYNIE
jgi:phosphate starvation-inducible PhoH-like protein